MAGRALQGRTRSGSPPGPGVNWPVFGHRNGAGLCFSLRLQNRSPGGLGGRGPLRIAERNKQVVYFQKRRGGAEACSQSQPKEESLSWATSPRPGNLRHQ